MIRGLHGLLYSSDERATRSFFRDQLKLPTNDIGGGWLIFDLPEADLGVHPVDPEEGGGSAGTHDVSFYCDDIQGTVAELKSRGVVFKGDIHGWVTYIDVPGGIVVQLYEPKYQKSAPRTAAAKPAKTRLAAAKPAKAAAKKKPAAKAAKAAKPAKAAVKPRSKPRSKPKSSPKRR
jgi:hypothetical protein